MRGMPKSPGRQWTGCAITCILRWEIGQTLLIELNSIEEPRGLVRAEDAVMDAKSRM
jgi:hypothetical protein